MSRPAGKIYLFALFLALLPILVRVVEGFAALPPDGSQLVGVNDPDSWLRLALVKDWMLGGSWADHSYASNAPFDRVISPWTRPLDLVIAGITHLQLGDAPLELKLLRTAILLPLVWMTLLASALLFAVRRLLALPHAMFALAILMVTSPILYNYFGAANADHHAPLAALFAWIVALTVTTDPKPWRHAIIVGMLLALMLWISPEALILIAIIFGWQGLIWIGGGSVRPLAQLATVVAIGTAVAIAIERPMSEWHVRLYDSISISQLLPLALVAVAAWLLTRVTSFFWLWRGLAASLLLGIAGAIVHVVDPLFFHGPMANVDPFIHSDFLPRITEAKSALFDPPLRVIALMLQPILAIWVALRCATQRDGILAPRHAAPLLYILLATLVLYLLQVRWSYYLYPVVALTLAPWLASWLKPNHKATDNYWPARKLRRLNEKQLVARRLPLLITVLGLPIFLLLGQGYLTLKDHVPARHCSADLRRIIQSGELNELGDGKPLNLLAATDAGGEILFFTHHRVVAANYHREGAALREAWNAQRTKSLPTLQKTLKDRKVDALVICPDRITRPSSALARLRAGTLKASILAPYSLKTKGLSDDPPAIFLVKGRAS